MKRFVSLLLCIALCFILVGPVYATHITADDEAKIVTNIAPEPIQISSDRIVSFQVYELDLVQMAMDHNNTTATPIELILSLCDYEETVIVGDDTFIRYSSNIVPEYLEKCHEITDISVLNDRVKIIYAGINGEYVVLNYNNSGLVSKTVYDENNDICIYHDEATALLYEKFREGSSYEINNAMMEEIDQLISAGKWEDIDSIEGIKVTYHSDGTHSIEPEIDYSPLSAGATSEAQLLSDLYSNFTPYTNKLMTGYVKYCNALEENVFIDIYESRDGYTKQSADFRRYAAGTAFDIISAYLELSKEVSVRNILGLLGAVFDAYDNLVREIMIYRGAYYTYRLERRSYVYDTSTYDDYVRVFDHGSKGVFSGGYDSNDDFTWIISSSPKTSDYSYDSIANTTIYNYNADLSINGYCSLYFPD